MNGMRVTYDIHNYEVRLTQEPRLGNRPDVEITNGLQHDSRESITLHGYAQIEELRNTLDRILSDHLGGD